MVVVDLNVDVRASKANDHQQWPLYELSEEKQRSLKLWSLMQEKIRKTSNQRDVYKD